MLSLESMVEAGIIPYESANIIKQDYIFLRRIEHYLQILEDRQIHTLPVDKNEINALAKRMLGPDADGGELLSRLDECLKRVRAAYERYLFGGEA